MKGKVKRSIRKGTFVRVIKAPVDLKKFIGKIGVVEGQFSDYRLGGESGKCFHVGFYTRKNKKPEIKDFILEQLKTI